MEKIKFGDSIYDLAPNGVQHNAEELHVIILWPDTMTYEEIENSMTGCERIEILAENRDVLEAVKGYKHLDQLRKHFDYVVRTEQVEDGVDENGEVLYTNKDVTSTVMIATLKRSDIWDTMTDMQEKFDNLINELSPGNYSRLS